MESRISLLMKKQGFTVNDTPAAYARFQKWTVDYQADFYRVALEDIRFPWMKSPSSTLKYSMWNPIWKARWFDGGEANVYNTCIEEQARRGLGKSTALIAYREDGRTVKLTFDEVKAAVDRIASRLKGDGIAKGDTVCVTTTASEYPYMLFYAIQKIGAVFVPIPTEIMDIALIKRLEMTKPKLIFSINGFIYGGKIGTSRDGLASAVAEASSKGGFRAKIVEIKYVEAKQSQTPDTVSYEKWLKEGPVAETTTEPLQNCDITMILFTSGTTGTPKGTRHSFCAHIEDMLENAYASNVNSGDVSFWYTSPGWMMFPWLVTGANGLGATAVLYDGSPRINGSGTMLEFANKFGITHMGVSPPIIVDMIDALESGHEAAKLIKSIKEVRYTSAPLADSIADRLARFGYHPNGACGGTDGCFCYCGGNPVTRRIGATMLPGLGIDVHVMVRAGRGWRDTGAGEIGELVIKSPFPSMTMGLLGDDDKLTRFRRTYFGHESEGGETKYWLHGDLASFDKDGYLTVHGRADDILVVHGSKLSPMDVQDAILAGNPEVQDAAAISMSLKPGDGGELLVFVVPRNEEANTAELEERIKNTVKDKINKLAKPYKVFFVRELPYTINNKPALRIIKSAFTGEPIGDTSTIRNPKSIEEMVWLSKDFKLSR